MAITVYEIACPGCGEPSSLSAKECLFCGRPVVISTFNSIKEWSAPQVSKYMKAYTGALAHDANPDVQLALGICLLKLGLYDLAAKHVNDAISANVDNAEAYLYAAVACLAGKRPFLISIADARSALLYLDAARMLEERGIFDYLSGFIREDFFERKFLRVSPSSHDEYQLAALHGATQTDVAFIHELIRVPLS